MLYLYHHSEHEIQSGLLPPIHMFQRMDGSGLLLIDLSTDIRYGLQ